MQVAGLAPLITQEKVDTVVISVGANDFFYHANIIDTVGGGLLPAPDGQIDEAFINDVADSILSEIDTLQAAGEVDIILGMVPTIPTMDEESVAGVEAVNDIIVAGAESRGVAVLDMMSWTTESEKVDPETGDVTIGHVVVEFGSVADSGDLGFEGDGLFCNDQNLCPLDSHAEKFMAEDGMHINTLMQGMLANEIIKELNSSFGHDIELITDAELLELVGVSPVPVPASVWLFGSALLGLAGLKRSSVKA